MAVRFPLANEFSIDAVPPVKKLAVAKNVVADPKVTVTDVSMPRLTPSPAPARAVPTPNPNAAHPVVFDVFSNAEAKLAANTWAAVHAGDCGKT
jgi:hypothetical protein